MQVLDNKSNGGESGIRTHVRVSPKHAFQACAFSHSAISPRESDGRNDSLRSLLPWLQNNNCGRFVLLNSMGEVVEPQLDKLKFDRRKAKRRNQT